MKSLKGENKKMLPIIHLFRHDDDMVIKENKLIADEFNEYFVNVGKKNANSIPPSIYTPSI